MTKMKHCKYLNIALLLVCNPCQLIEIVFMCVFEKIISTCRNARLFLVGEAQVTQSICNICPPLQKSPPQR
jgi:hypothetical protein